MVKMLFLRGLFLSLMNRCEGQMGPHNGSMGVKEEPHPATYFHCVLNNFLRQGTQPRDRLDAMMRNEARGSTLLETPILCLGFVSLKSACICYFTYALS